MWNLPSEIKMLNWPPKVFHRNDHRAPSELRNSSFWGTRTLDVQPMQRFGFQPGHIKVGFAYTDSGIPYLNENLSYRLSSCYTEPSNPSPLWLIQPICKGRKSSKSWWTTSAGALALLKGPGEPPKAIRIAFHQTGLLWLNLVGANQILKCSPKKSTEDVRNYGGKHSEHS